MKNRTFRSGLCAVLCLVLVLSAAGCQAKKQAVNLREKLFALAVTDEDLGIAGAYSALSDIEDGKADPELEGKWITGDGKTVYTYAADGTVKIESEDYGSFDSKYTCFTRGDHKILCEEATMNSTDVDGNTTESTALIYTAYRVENDALYMVTVEERDEKFSSHQAALVMLFRADGSGSTSAAMAKNPISMDSLNGTWSGEKGDFTIENGTLKTGSDSYALSFNEKNQLVAEKDGRATAYSMNVSVYKTYGDQPSQTVRMGLYYTGADENDKPNLLPLLDDWKTDYQWEDWYYAGSFELE